jgi:hypothetical protein
MRATGRKGGRSLRGLSYSAASNLVGFLFGKRAWIVRTTVLCAILGAISRPNGVIGKPVHEPRRFPVFVVVRKRAHLSSAVAPVFGVIKRREQSRHWAGLMAHRLLASPFGLKRRSRFRVIRLSDNEARPVGAGGNGASFDGRAGPVSRVVHEHQRGRGSGGFNSVVY